MKGDEGFVNIGSYHDTAQGAVVSIRLWWAGRRICEEAYTDYGGLWGSNAYRSRLWKRELERRADERGLSFSAWGEHIKQDRTIAYFHV
jgi:hypothetical protein